LKPGAFKLRVNWIQLVQPHHAGGVSRGGGGGGRGGRRDAGAHAPGGGGGARWRHVIVPPRGVAVQVKCESQNLKPVNQETRKSHFRFEGWDSTCTQPHRGCEERRRERHRALVARRGGRDALHAVAAQVAFERANFETVFSLTS
jgi:hypothetical protein